MNRLILFALSILVLGFVNRPLAAQQPLDKSARHITTPKEHLGFNLGDDFCLANYQQLRSYWAKLEKESDRLKVVTIGTTEEGRPQLMGIVTSPANHKKLDHYQQIARRLARAEGLSTEEADKLAIEGKAVVWIDGGLHASETLCAQALMETLYQFLAANDAESLRILDDVIILFVQANPDGMDLVADHYMKSAKVPKDRKTGGLGRLYQKYIGHDNNRDFYANTQAETKNMNRVMYREWLPQIVYNHHQSGPPGTVVFIPPCADPFNYNIHPIVIGGIEAVGTNMVLRYLTEGKPGATTRSGFTSVPAWFNGDLSTTPQFHNMIGLFTETVGGPAPTDIPFLAKKQLPNSDYLAPIPPQKWHFRQSLDYSVSGNKAVLDYASRHREHLLKSIWIMGRDAIEAGSRDSWTVTPKAVAAAAAAAVTGTGKGGGKGAFGKGGGGGAGAKEFERFLRDPAKRDPRGYIIPADQPDFLTATKFINTLLGNGCVVYRAKADFEVDCQKYPQGSYVVKCAQAFRPHVLAMFEPQDHPPETRAPQDQAGWTLAYMMGVQFDRILEDFYGPFEELQGFEIKPPAAKVKAAKGAMGFFLSPKMNDSFRAVNLLLKAGEEVLRLQEPCTIEGIKHPAGTFFIKAKPTTLPLLEKIAAEVGTPFTGSSLPPGKEAAALKPVRIGLWDYNNGSMPSGWTRWILERFDFPYKVIYNDTLAEANLKEDFDVLLFVEGGGGGGGGGGFGLGEQNIKYLKKFVESGGTILATGASTSMGKQLGLPLSNVSRGTSSIHHSIVRVKVDPETPLTWGMDENADVMFSNSPTFKLPADAADKGLVKLAWFATKTPLRSGLATGQEYLEGGVAMIDAKLGEGRLALFGPPVLFRAQQHSTFKLIFNGIVQAGIASSAATGGAGKDDTLDGTWLPSSAELAGKQFPDEVRKTIKLVVKGDKYTVTVGKDVDQGTVKLNPAAKPKAMDITGSDGPNKGKTILAIYERKGDTLRVCYDLSGKNRPTEFKTEAGTQQFLVEYQRQKD
jgi:uncharacterized protein (TIGR03067 family)